MVTITSLYETRITKKNVDRPTDKFTETPSIYIENYEEISDKLR